MFMTHKLFSLDLIIVKLYLNKLENDYVWVCIKSKDD